MGKETFEGKKTHCTIGTIGYLDHGKTTLTDAITKTLSTRVSGKTISASNIEYETRKRHYTHIDCSGHANDIKNLISAVAQMDGAILVVSATDGIMPQTAEQIMIAQHMGVQHMVVFMNKCDIVDDMEMLELVEMGIRDQLCQYGFPGFDIPFIYGSASKAVEDSDGEWGDKIMELMDVVDNYIPDSHPKMDQASSMYTKFTAEVYMLDTDEGGRDTEYFDNDRLQFYFRTVDGTGEIQLPIEIDMVVPGDNVEMTIELNCSIAITEGEPFVIRDEGCTVGLGRVVRIIE